VPEPTPKPTPLALNLTGLAKNSTGNATGNATNATDAVNATPPPAEASASPDAASAASVASPDASAPANASTAAPSPKMKLVKNTLHFPLTITLITEGAFPVTPLNASEKAAVLVRFRALKAEDDAKRALEGAKNALEAAIFATNDWLETMADAVSKVTNAAQRSEVAAATANHTEWLESDSVGAGISVFQDRLQALQDLVDPIKFRIEEHEERPNLLEAATKALSTWTTTVKSWTDTHPQVR